MTLLLVHFMAKNSEHKAKHAIKVSQTDIPLYLYLSVLGMTGQTAYHGLLKSDNHKKVRLL